MIWNLSDLSWEAFRDRVPDPVDTVLVPVGTIEAHGAMALGTDTIIPAALARDLAPRLGALTAPAIAYGVTNSLLPYPGSTTVSSATFQAYLYEAAAGLVDAGFRRVVLLNGHGGQSSEVAGVVRRLWTEKQVYTVAIEWWGFVEALSHEIYGDVASGHSGVEETAMVLAIAPDGVDGARHTAIRRTHRNPGVMARPFPASIILDRPEKNDDGAPVLDPDKARRFYDGTLVAVEAGIRSVFEGWDAIQATPRAPHRSRP
jgi:creatinine amidohydrolase